jgi:HPt (histidine-containing phosphotransfer) domain-containing protein
MFPAELPIIRKGDVMEQIADSIKILIRAPQGIPRDLVTEYLERCRRGMPLLMAAVGENHHAQLRVLGHRMKGTGAPYGFPKLTEIGGLIEQAAVDENSGALRAYAAELEEYIGRVEIAVD